MNTRKHPSLSPWLIWGLACAFFFFEFMVRVAPSGMLRYLMESFTLSAAGIGFVNACYFYVFAPAQIPIGPLMDRYGARRLVFWGSVLMTFGCLIFATAYGGILAATGRIFMGLGSSVGFVAVVYISSHWFAKERLAFLVGMANSIGMLGAVIGQGPTSLITESFGWRSSFFLYLILGVFLTILIGMYLKNDPNNPLPTDSSPSKDALGHFVSVAKSPLTWLNGVAGSLFYSVTSVFAGLWGIDFLSEVHGIKNSSAAFGISLIFVGWMIGGPVMGKLADYWQKEKTILWITPLGALCCLLPILYTEALHVWALYPLLLLLGFFSSAQILNYTISIELLDPSSKGTVIAITNFVVMMGSSFMQPLVGFLLDSNWSGQMDGLLRVYTKDAWLIATSVFPIALFLTFLINLLMPKKGHQHNPEVSF